MVKAWRVPSIIQISCPSRWLQLQALSQTVSRCSIAGQNVLVTVPNTVWPQLPCGKRGQGQVRHLDVNQAASLSCTAEAPGFFYCIEATIHTPKTVTLQIW